MTPPLHEHDADQRFGRRESLVKAGGLAIAVLGAGALPAEAATSTTETSAVSCVLAPEMTEGPFYIANEKVLVPTFNDPHDRIALGVLSDLFPMRTVVGIHAVDLVWGFGTLHCMTQQQPKGS